MDSFLSNLFSSRKQSAYFVISQSDPLINTFTSTYFHKRSRNVCRVSAVTFCSPPQIKAESLPLLAHVEPYLQKYSVALWGVKAFWFTIDLPDKSCFPQLCISVSRVASLATGHSSDSSGEEEPSGILPKKWRLSTRWYLPGRNPAVRCVRTQSFSFKREVKTIPILQHQLPPEAV